MTTHQHDTHSPSDILQGEETNAVKEARELDDKLIHEHPILGPLHQHPSLRKSRPRTATPLRFFNPTRAHFILSDPNGAAVPASYKWTSRNNRKGRHGLAVSHDALPPKSHYQLPPSTSSLRETCHGIWRMFTYFPIWDVSYDVATVFTWGSVVWVVNAFLVYLPLVRPETEFNNEILYGGGISAFIGATIFVWGSILLMIEAVNENRTGCFGWAMEHAFEDAEKDADTVRLRPSKSVCTHHHCNKRNLVGKASHTQQEISADVPRSASQRWIWWPTMAELRNHYFREIGFLASFTQLIAALIFEIAGITSLPGIINHMSRPILIIFYWTPQIVGGTGFIISGALFMLETQSRWYKPAFGTLGWWIGAWNMIGGFGFTLCPAFGYDTASWAQYQASLSTYWGSWAFLIGSVIQWYESLVKHPVEVRSSKGRA